MRIFPRLIIGALLCLCARAAFAQSTTNLAIPKPPAGDPQPAVRVAQGFDLFDIAVAGLLSKSVAGSSDVPLTVAEARRAIHEYTGTLTGNINVIVPTKTRLYAIYNATSGAFSLTVKTSGGTGIAVTQGTRSLLYCDGTNVVNVLAGDKVNGLTVTSSTGTLTIANGKTLTASNTLTLTGTDGSSAAFGAGGVVAYYLTGSASLDFGATAAGTCETAGTTITVTGAADGDVVILGIPNALITADAYQSFYGWVSSSNTVSVRRCNLTNAVTALSDPGAATIKATIIRP